MSTPLLHSAASPPAPVTDGLERARLAATLDATTDFVCIAAEDGRVEYLNQAGRALLGLASGVDPRTLNARDFHTRETVALLRRVGLPIAIADGVWRGDGHLRARSGESIPVSIALTMQPGASPDAPRYFSAIMRDRRAEVAAAARLRASEERFRAVLENVPVGVAVLGGDGVILHVNEALATFLGVTAAQLEGTQGATLLPTSDLAPLRDALAEVRAGARRSATLERCFRRADGERRWATLTLSRMPLGDGAFGLVVLATDITARRVAELELEKSRAYFEAVLESLSDGVVACDADGRLQLFNRASRELHGLGAEPLEPEGWAQHYHLFRDDGLTPLPTDAIPLARALRGEVVRDATVVVAHGSGSKRTLLASGQAIRTPDGTPLGAVIALRDVTERSRAEHEVRLLLQVTHAMASASDAPMAMRAALEAMCEAVGWEYGEAWLPPPDSPWSGERRADTVRFAQGPVWYAPDDAQLVWFCEQSARLTFGAGEGLPGRVAETAAPVFVAELADDDRISRLGPACAAGLRSAYAVPILVDARVAAVLTFFTRGASAVAEAQVELLAAVAAQLGGALQRTMAEARLREERTFLASVLDSLSENVSVCTPDGRLVLFNRATGETHGLPSQGPLTFEEWTRFAEVYEADGVTPLPKAALPHVRVLDERADVHGIELVVHAPGREARTLVANAHVMRAADGSFAGSVCAARDMTEQKAAEGALRESESAFRGMLETVRALAIILDRQGRVKFVNDAVLELTGWTREQVIGVDWYSRFVPDAAAHRRIFDGMIAGRDTIPHVEHEIVTRTGRRRLVVWDNTVLRDALGRITGSASIGQDVTEQRAMQERLAALSEHDELTGLLNRRGFVQRLEYAMKTGARSARCDALLYVDLDRFKPINDTYGHAAGDEALCAVASLLRGAVRDADVVGRLGGDEFAIYAIDVQEQDGGSILAARLQQALEAHNREATDRGRPYAIGFSVGFTQRLPGDSRDALLARADAALYQKKHRRR